MMCGANDKVSEMDKGRRWCRSSESEGSTVASEGMEMRICFCVFFFLMIRRPQRSTPLYSSAASGVYERQGPTLSSDQHSAMHPLRDTRPYVGRKPVAPQRSDGNVIEPSVSVPIAKPHRPAAVAATLRKSFLRFRTVPKEFALLPRHCVNRRID